MIVELKFIWDKNRFLRVMKERRDLNLKGCKSRIVMAFLVFYLAVGILFAVCARTYFVLILAGAIIVYWFFLSWPLRKLFLMNQFRKYPERDKAVSLKIAEEGLTVDSAAYQGTFSWSAVTEAVETPNGFLIVRYPVYSILFFDDFGSSEQIEWFRRMLKEKAVKFNKKS